MCLMHRPRIDVLQDDQDWPRRIEHERGRRCYRVLAACPLALLVRIKFREIDAVLAGQLFQREANPVVVALSLANLKGNGEIVKAVEQLDVTLVREHHASGLSAGA